jgi:ribonuclease P protein component
MARRSNRRPHNSSPIVVVTAPASSLARDGSHSDETHLSALQGSPRPHAWISRAHEDAWRPRRAQRQARQGPQAPVVGLSAATLDVATVMLGRLPRPADFESVLAAPAKARSAHFAAHHLPSRPQQRRDRRESDPETKLSTGGPAGCPQPVDDHSIRASTTWWFGVVVPKRHARKATTRNLLRRQIRGAMARHHAQLARGMWLVRLRAPFDPRRFKSASSAELRSAARIELDALLTRAAA